MKLSEAMDAYNVARSAAINRAEDVRKARIALDQCERALAECERQHARAQSHFVDAVAQLHPLLDADVAGVTGKKSVPPERGAPQLADDEVTLP